MTRLVNIKSSEFQCCGAMHFGVCLSHGIVHQVGRSISVQKQVLSEVYSASEETQDKLCTSTVVCFNSRTGNFSITPHHYDGKTAHITRAEMQRIFVQVGHSIRCIVDSCHDRGTVTIFWPKIFRSGPGSPTEGFPNINHRIATFLIGLVFRFYPIRELDFRCGTGALLRWHASVP